MAHFPTYYPAIGRDLNLKTDIRSAKDQTAHTKLKYRVNVSTATAKATPGGTVAVDTDSADLNSKEKAFIDLLKEEEKVDVADVLNKSKVANEKVASILSKYDDEDVERSDDESNDDDQGGKSNGKNINDDDSDYSDDDSDDDEEELRAELERIKAERQLAQAKSEEEKQIMKQKEDEESAIHGNPLLKLDTQEAPSGSTKIKRRWNDDVVFRNKAKDEPKNKQARFINDAVRSDFHKLFMAKFFK